MNAERGPEVDYGIDPFEMSVLSKKFEMATREVSQVLKKSARSGVIAQARDFSSGFTLFDGRQFMIDEGLPVHAANLHLTPEYILEHFDDISPGDCFLTNSPYAGSTHHADYTLSVPVFYEGEPLFWVINRAHQADVGAPEPTTYPAEAANIYQEGPHFPAVRIQEGFEDRADIVRMIALNVRLGETQWLGDYRGQVAAVRKGEARLQEICEEYGVDRIRDFVDAWLEYGNRMMRKHIADLPERELEYAAYHDPIPGAPDGVEVRVTLSIDPKAEQISVDVTENMESVPSGFNLSEATTTAAVYAGIFNNLDTDIPHNHGAIEPIQIEMDEGKIIGKQTYPAGTAVATTEVCHVLINAVQAAFGELGEPHGLSEATTGILDYPVISGTDFRRDDEEYINQIFLTAGGGPAGSGFDGWLTYTSPGGGAVPNRDSVELDEGKFPILIRRSELRPDSEGAGRWRGAPGSINVIEPRRRSMNLAYTGNHRDSPARGILGGDEAACSRLRKITSDGREIDLPYFGVEEIEPNETVVIEDSGSGGYGDPFSRDRHRVLADVESGLISPDRARTAYGVAISETESRFEIDDEATHSLRDEQGETR
ncbi:MAG: hydantoinase B/oxoprolinase family protein [Natronomonas sp.]|uniref:hydantoinase B/oxoprolinase family protein n=1 Tax=Natronomonas sp. TaxID=2184060 RepID=UPI0028708ADC|nr:hydantoinase B/oxoprolinase family protein [Natronomonas sp.]MDR9429916.1 hydantoinase B/oxoprolinase family protein [Natronomonas sp.]